MHGQVWKPQINNIAFFVENTLNELAICYLYYDVKYIELVWAEIKYKFRFILRIMLL